MIDGEVSRLRQLRNSALKVRAIAYGLQTTLGLIDDPVLNRVACSAWRISRIVSGRLLGHPYLEYQRGPTVLQLVGHVAQAASARLMAVDRARSLRTFSVKLRKLLRELDNTRSLTWTLELSACFARSQAELSSALHVIELQVGTTSRQIYLHANSAPSVAGASSQGTWPYIAR